MRGLRRSLFFPEECRDSVVLTASSKSDEALSRVVDSRAQLPAASTSKSGSFPRCPPRG